MKKKLAPLLLALTFLLTSCTGEETHENISGLEITEIPLETTETFLETSFSESAENIPEKADDSEKTLSPESPAAPDAEAEETSSNPSEASAAETSPAEKKLPISLYDSPAEPYDNVIPAEYTVIDSALFPDYDPESRGARFPSDDKEAEKAALRAYKESDYYKQALELAKELFTYENGELVFLKNGWYADSYVEYIDESSAPEIDLKAKVIDSEKAKFDGKTEESIFFISFAGGYTTSTMDPADFAVPVYVNSRGEAFILDSAGYQTRISVSFVKYGKSGKIHMISGGAHSEGTMRSAIFSFENGQPKKELYVHGAVLQSEENGKLFQWKESNYFYSFIFYSEELSRYCGIDGVPPSEKAAEAICSDKTLLEKEPDIRTRYENGRLWIIGGKYVFVVNNSYEYDGSGFVSTGEYSRYIPVLPNDNPDSFFDFKYIEKEYIFNVPIDGVPPK